MRTHVFLAGGIALALAATAAGASAQSLERRVSGAPDGTVRFSFAAREGVCGTGHNINISDGRNPDWESDCDDGPVRTVLTIADGRVTRLRSSVGGRWRPAGSGVTDLGTVPAREAAAYLIGLAERAPSGSNEAVFAATLADSAVIWPELIRLAKNQSVPRETRRSAVFWLGQAAGVAATASLDSLVGDPKGDREVREAAVFALSQRPHDEGVPVLIRIAQTDRDPAIRKKAIFWLGQSDDPRAIALFENLLTKR
jgi:hypothetical protein